jgi:zinc and cadmium transporter
MEVWMYAIASVLIVSLVSLVGVFAVSLDQRKLKKGLLLLVAFSAGALVGDAFLHLLPEAVEELGFGLEVSLMVLLGIVVMFVVEKVVHWHHCHAIGREHKYPAFAITNLVGDAVHNFIDGVIIAASYLVSIPIGIATTLAVIFHEIPEEIGDFGVLLHGGFSIRKALFVNLLVGLVSVLGALSVLLWRGMAQQHLFWLLAFAAGNFIYISNTDLIPELHKRAELKNSFFELAAFLAGIGMMGVLLLLQ